MVGEIIQGLAHHGFRRFALANYQADPGHLRAMALIKRDAQQRRRVQVLFAGFTPGRPSEAMVNPRVTALLRSPQPEREWHSGELETAMMLWVLLGYLLITTALVPVVGRPVWTRWVAAA